MKNKMPSIHTAAASTKIKQSRLSQKLKINSKKQVYQAGL
jgi:hypothetical protein